MNLIVNQDLFTGLLLFDRNNIVVNLNQKVELDCGISSNYYYCIWEKDNDFIQVKICYNLFYFHNQMSIW